MVPPRLIAALIINRVTEKSKFALQGFGRSVVTVRVSICYHTGMRGGFIITLIVVLLFSGGYFYYIAEAVCPAPLAYRLGELDKRFQLSEDEAKLAIAEAESVWEDATGSNLFTYDDTADFTINFVFDDRQAFTDAEEDFKERLDQTENINESIAAEYEELIAEYEALKSQYEADASTYESRLATYNEEVEEFNQGGGAPPAEYQRLENEKDVLDDTQTKLGRTARTLNQLVDKINRVGDEGNQVIETYNRNVSVYNRTFGEPREFTQGDYQGDYINIYTFNSEAELKLVLAHELGHALHLGHVEGEESLMYYLIGGQIEPLELSEEDSEAFAKVCGDGFDSLLERLKIRLGWL